MTTDKPSHGSAPQHTRPTLDDVRSGLPPAGRSPGRHEGNHDQPEPAAPVSAPDPAAARSGPERGISGSRRLYDYLHAPAPPLAETLDSFWSPRVPLDELPEIPPPSNKPYEILRCLGPSPFEHSSFPLIGFLASAYERVSGLATERTKR